MQIANSFLEKLLTKLKSGDARSIHLNALPGNFARLDIYDLVNIDQSLHLKFLEFLLTKNEFQFSINIDTTLLDNKTADEKKIIQKIAQRLNHLDYQEKEAFAEHGYHSFGFGYPLVIKRDPNNKEKIIKAPLLIWYLTIEKNTQKNNTWTISRKEDQPVVFNELLQSHLESSEKIKTDDIEVLLNDELITEQQLTNLCKVFLEKLNVPFNAKDTIATILPCTNKETIELLSKESTWIRWSGVFGLYKMLKQAIIKDVENLIEQQTVNSEHVNNTNEDENFEGEVLTPIMLDPSQENVLHQIKENNTVLIQGPPGTGKSQSLTAVLTLALLKGQKTLIVCEKRTAMEVLYNNLKKNNLQHLAVLIEDVYTDRKQIVETVRTFIENENTPPPRFRANEYEQLQSKFLSLQEELNYRIQFANKEIFGDDNWTEILCRSIELNANDVVLEKANSINKTIKNSDYDYSYDEFIFLSKKIDEAHKLYVKVNTNSFNYDNINKDRIIQNSNYKVIYTDIQKQYEDALALQNKIVKNSIEFKNNFIVLNSWKNIAISILSLISSKYKKIKKEKENTISDYNKLETICKEQNYFMYEFVSCNSIEKFHDLFPTLKAIQGVSQQIIVHENQFEHFFNYKKYILQQDSKTQAIIDSLEKTENNNWQSIFETYYLNQFILKTALENSIKANTQQLFDDIEKTDITLKEKISDKINFLWQQKQQKLVQSKDVTTLKYLYNQRKNKQFATKNSLRKILHDDMDFFTTIFPVVMVNPTVSASILPLTKNNFEYIILDEASQLRIEDTFTALYRGTTKIISGDKHQMPPSNFFGNEVVFWNEDETENEEENFLVESKSLLEFASDANYKSANLDFHYRSLHPSLIEFSNHAFYQSRLIPMPEKKVYQALFYNNVNGIYKNGVNETEANTIVDFIYNFAISANNCPSIGIATFNIHQRNLIYDKLYEAAYKDTQKSEQLQLLITNGLFVKNLENIQGDERDIMLLSTTFGKDEDGKFRQFFGPLTQEKGYQLLNVIITRAKHSLYVFTSIPETVFLNYEAELNIKGNVGKSIFYAYLAYVKAQSENNNTQIDFIKNILQKTKDTTKAITKSQNEIIKQQVYNALKEIFKENVLYQYQLGGYLLDIVLLKNNLPFLYIDFENTQNYHNDVTYRIKLHQQNIIQPYGIKVYHLWSYDWWLNQKHEIQQIINLYQTL